VYISFHLQDISLPVTPESLPLSHLTTPWQKRGSSRTSGSGCSLVTPRRRNSDATSGASIEDSTQIEDAVTEVETQVTVTHHQEETSVPPDSDSDDESEYNPEIDEVIICKLYCTLNHDSNL
jgi:hypothetical protein